MINNTGLLWYCGGRGLAAQIPRALERYAARLGITPNRCDVAPNLALPDMQIARVRFDHSRNVTPGHIMVYHGGEDMLWSASA